MRVDEHDEGASIRRLVRQTADGLADLVGQHLKLARLELTREVFKAARRARVIALLALLAVVGYGLTMAGLAVWLGDNHRVGVALLGVGLAHVVGAAIGMLVTAPRAAAPHMAATGHEARRTFSTLAPPVAANGMEKTHGA